MATVNTNNYTIGQVDLYFTATAAHGSLLATDNTVASGLGGAFRTSGRSLGNIVTAEISPEVSYVEHYVADKGRRKKDKIAANTVSLTIPFTFDEVNEANLQNFFLASDLTGNKMAVFEQPLQIGSAQLFFNTDVGNDITYFIPKCTIRPDGNLSINTEDWWTVPMVMEVLFYDTSHWASKPYGYVFASNIS